MKIELPPHKRDTPKNVKYFNIYTKYTIPDFSLKHYELLQSRNTLKTFTLFVKILKNSWVTPQNVVDCDKFLIAYPKPNHLLFKIAACVGGSLPAITIYCKISHQW